jgi:hypothetical protein
VTGSTGTSLPTDFLAWNRGLAGASLSPSSGINFERKLMGFSGTVGGGDFGLPVVGEVFPFCTGGSVFCPSVFFLSICGLLVPSLVVPLGDGKAPLTGVSCVVGEFVVGSFGITGADVGGVDVDGDNTSDVGTGAFTCLRIIGLTVILGVPLPVGGVPCGESDMMSLCCR